MPTPAVLPLRKLGAVVNLIWSARDLYTPRSLRTARERGQVSMVIHNDREILEEHRSRYDPIAKLEKTNRNSALRKTRY